MRKKDGESGTDGSLPIPDLDIWDSLHYLTGGTVLPVANDPIWTNMECRLRSAGFSPFEYIYYIAVHSQRDSGMKSSVATLAIKNVCVSDKMWRGFLVFKSGLPLELDVNMRLQRDILNSSTRTNGLHYVLKHPYFEVGPSLRVESALKMLRIGRPEYADIIQMWGLRAGEVLLGLPQIALHLPTTINALKEEDSYAARHLFPWSGD